MEGMQVLVNWDSHKSYRDENGLIEDIITFVYSMLCMIPTVDKYFFIIPYVAFRGMQIFLRSVFKARKIKTIKYEEKTVSNLGRIV